MIRFYAPEISRDPVLPESDSQHCVKVLRLQPGAQLEVVDGRGGLYRCELLDAHRKHALVKVLEREELPLPWSYELQMVVAPTKHLDRMEWLTEKLTEIGVNRLTPALCARSERKELKTERLEKIAVSAMKQSLKAVLPRIDEMTPLKRIIAECTAAQRFICYCDAATPRRDMARIVAPQTDTCILIGPEGDFSPEEVAAALEAGFVPVTLGNNRLRTETAALVAATTVHVINQIS